MPSGHRPSSPAESSAGKRTADAVSEDKLPGYVQATVPNCALPCLSSHVEQHFPCPDNDISCLCSNYSSDFFTLGEYAYICLRSNCSEYTLSEADETYNICAVESNAVPATHSILTIPAPSPTATPSITRQTIPAIQTATASPTPAPATTTSQLATSGMPNPTVSVPDSTSQASPTSAPAPSNTLTSAQAIGVSIAAVGAAIIVIGAVWLFACRRRRRARKGKEERHSYDFIDDASPRFSAFNHGAADPRGSLGGFAFPTVDPLPEKRRAEWPSQYHDGAQCQYHGYTPYHDYKKGTGRSPYVATSTPLASHRSDYSIRTTSQLLPDKPTTMPLASPKRSSVCLMSPATVFEEERSPPVPPAAVLPGLSAGTITSQRPLRPQFRNQYTSSPKHVQQPQLAVEIPKQVNRSGSIQHLGAFPPPPPPLRRPPALQQTESENRMSERSQAHTSSTSLLNYYTSTEVSSPDLYFSTPIDEQIQIRRPPPAAIIVTKSPYPTQAMRSSAMSDHSNRTSFESSDPDEPTPPDEAEKRLTPVAESPIATIRYPKVPRSSNQSVPRSPVHQISTKSAVQCGAREAIRAPQRRDGNSSPVPPDRRGRGHAPTLSGSTLAAKRRGDSLAHDLERGLHIKHSNHSRNNSLMSSKNHNSKPTQPRPQMRHDSPLKGYGRVTGPSRPEPDWPLTLHLSPEMKTPPDVRSPLWEPKLTPRREGDDLYLDLSLATPVHAHFQQRM